MPSLRLAYLNRPPRRLGRFLAGYAEVVSVATFGFPLLENRPKLRRWLRVDQGR